MFETLTAVADRTQPAVVDALAGTGAEYRRFWIANLVWVRGDITTVEATARLPQVARIIANPRVSLADPIPAGRSGKSRDGIEWNISLVGGPDVWAAGNRGQDGVVGGIDTGYDWDHPALINQYRGWDGMSATHDHNWHDAIHSGGGICGPDSPEPCDDHSHGTHTMGIMVGDDGGVNQIGLAPEARWIGCRCMDEGFGTPATYTECLQWMVAPTDLNDENPDPALAPDAINNSWVCTVEEGCVDPNELRVVLENVRAAGIVVVASTGNSGDECESVEHPPAIYDAAFSVGATKDTDEITGFSSRGPVTVDGSGRLKPDICAPGLGVYSCLPDGEYGSYSGTSMAGPHVAGLVALLVTTNPTYQGEVDELEHFIRFSAVPLTTDQECGGIPGSEVPNNTFGYGRIDAWAAHQLIDGYVVEVPPAVSRPLRATLLPNTPNPFNPTTVIGYELSRPAVLCLRIYDASGRRITELVGPTHHRKGRHAATWHGQDSRGRNVPSGVYFCRLEIGSWNQTRRLVLVR